MTFNPDAKIDPGKVSKRGRNTGIAVGGGGVGVIALVLISQLLGVDLSAFAPLLGGGGTSQAPPGQAPSECTTGEDANRDIECRMVGAASSLDAYWSAEFDAAGWEYRSPGFALFEDATNTGCGGATSAVGPFYCPTDETIYLDTGFYDELRGRFGASGGPLAEMYVVAHEWGHHVQNLIGAMDGLDLRDTGPDSDSVRLELQADCFGGSWAKDASTVPDAQGTPYLEPISAAQIADALNAAQVIGDDRIQAQAQGAVNPETWTHGSSEQRQRWFMVGFDNGHEACDTFSGAP